MTNTQDTAHKGIKTIRDAGHGSIGFDRSSEVAILELIDSPEFQRLRHIRQLGAVSWVFPSADHTRFSHCIGVCHVARRIFDSVHKFYDGELPGKREKVRLAVMAAALLHDIGHGPYSHLFEGALPKDRLNGKHEAWTLRLIQGPNTGVARILEDRGIKDLVVAITEKQAKPVFLNQIVSSQLDADRMDYLLRDSKWTGVVYGHFDLDWLISVLRINPSDHSLAVDKVKGLHATEHFVLGRHLMLEQVYFHKTVRAAEGMIKMALRRFFDMAEDRRQIPLFCPPPMDELYESEPLTLQRYLALTDATLDMCLLQWGESLEKAGGDETLHGICQRLAQRRLFKTVLLGEDNPLTIKGAGGTYSAIEQAFEEFDMPIKYWLIEDKAEHVIYKDVGEAIRKGEDSEDIWMVGGSGGPELLSALSDVISATRNKKLRVMRLVFPQELADSISAHFGQSTQEDRQ